MKKYYLLFVIALISFSSFSQKEYKLMMNDLSVNFYDVCKGADAYFDKHEKGKGSGWKGYQRWKKANEFKFYPDGDRSTVDPYFAKKAYQSYLRNNQSSNKDLFSNGWNELGPYRVDSITGGYSAGIGRVEDFYIDPNNTNLIYLGSRSGGFWKSVDGGTTWQGGSTDFLMASGVNTLTVSPSDPNSILINVRNSNNANSHGIYQSFDAGNSWSLSNFNPTNLSAGGLGSSFIIYEIRYHPRVANLVFIGTSQGIYRSDDNFVTWTQLLNSGDIEEIKFHPTNNDIIYLYDSYYWGNNKNYVMRSTDQGLSYIQSSEVIGNNDNRSVHLSVSADCSNCLYFASDEGVWKSIDEGVNFTFISTPNTWCGNFTVNDLDTTKMIFGSLDAFSSNDGGQTFNQITEWSLGNTNGAGSGHQISFNTSTDYIHADVRQAKSINGVYYLGTDGFLCKSSDNGTTWQILNQGVAIRENYKVGVSQSNHYRSVSGSQDNGTSIKHKGAWVEFFGADGMEGIIHPLNDDWIIGSYQFGGRLRTKDGGQTLGVVTPSGQDGWMNAAWEAPLDYDPNNQMSIYNFSKAIFRSNDFGSSWDSIGVPLTMTQAIDNAVIAENNSSIIIVSEGENIDKSTDGGVTFSSIKNNLPSYFIQDIAINPNNDDVIIVVYGRYQNDNKKVYITINGGNSWSNITSNLGGMPIRSVVIDHTNASNIYLGAEIGVYTKPMNGNTWTLYNSDLPNTSIKDMEIVYGSNTIKAATWGRGLWEYSLVGRNSYPAIVTTRITDQPNDIKPKYGVDQFVTSTISYSNTLSNVYVEWSVDTAIFNNVIAMSNTVDSTWISNTALPSQPNGTKIFFRVVAVGNSNDTTVTYKFMYDIHDIPVGIAKAEQFDVEIYPNPTGGIFTVKLGKVEDLVKVELTNITGQLVFSRKMESVEAININIENYIEGVYFLSLYLNNNRKVYKIIKK